MNQQMAQFRVRNVSNMNDVAAKLVAFVLLWIIYPPKLKIHSIYGPLVNSERSSASPALVGSCAKIHQSEWQDRRNQILVQGLANSPKIGGCAELVTVEFYDGSIRS